MGTGKTAVGTCLARKLNMEFLDMDLVIEAREGRTVSEIFADSGEPYFRSQERALVCELCGRRRTVIAAGGGIVLEPQNFTDFQRHGLVVCLFADPDTLLERVATDTQRPLLVGRQKKERILHLLQSRRELYNAIPHQIDTTELSVDQVVERICALYGAC